MKQLVSFYKPSMHNDLHMAFHKMVIGLLFDNYEDLGLNETAVIGYQNSIDHEQTFVNRTLGSQYTEQIREADKTRDNALRYLITRLQAIPYGTSDNDVKYRDVIQKYILDKYPLTLTGIGDKEETAQIAGLLTDLKLPEIAKCITDEGLTAAVTKLTIANTAFENVYLARNEERSQLVLEDMAKTRVANDEYFDRFANEVLVKANNFDTSAADYAHANQLLEQFNQLLTDYKARVKLYGGNPDPLV